MRRILTALLCMALGASGMTASGQEGERPGPAAFDLGADRFVAGRVVLLEGEGLDDVFMAGGRIRIADPIAGTAHLAGRRVGIAADIGGSVYAAGVEVALTGRVAGDATLTGYEVSVSGPVGGDLRASGYEVRLDAPVAGTALLAGETVELDAVVTGDAAILAERMIFGDDARIEGRLTVYAEDPEAVEVPERVVPPDRLEIREIRDVEHDFAPKAPDAGSAAASALGGLVFWSVLTFVLALIGWAAIPARMAGWTGRLRDAPGSALVAGFLILSALIGAGVLLALTIVGVVTLPLLALASGLAVMAGYAMGAQVLGLRLWQALGGTRPGSAAGLAGLAAGGAFLAGLAMLIPLLGWLFVLALTLAGIGALLGRLMPRGGGFVPG